jgi:hypothetical protein
MFRYISSTALEYTPSLEVWINSLGIDCVRSFYSNAFEKEYQNPNIPKTTA